jgi:hypothetical protein
MAIDPNCGMTLEPKTVTADTDDEENAELRDMTKRFWIGAAPPHVLSVEQGGNTNAQETGTHYPHCGFGRRGHRRVA